MSMTRLFANRALAPMPQSTAAPRCAFALFIAPLRAFATDSGSPHSPSPSRQVMDFLTHHGPQTRRALYTHFGPGQTGVVRSKGHLTTLLRQLTDSRRVLTKPMVVDGKKSGLFVYEMRDYDRSWNKQSVARAQSQPAMEAEAQQTV